MNRGARDFIVDESGAVALIMALAIVALLGMAALTVDYGYMSAVQNQLQNAADAGALAGAAAFGSNSPNSAAAQTAATNAATAVVQTNYWGNQNLTGCTVNPGYWSFVNSKFTGTTSTNATLPTETPPALWAVQVVVAKNGTLNGGPLQLFFAPVLRLVNPSVSTTKNLSGTAVAVVKSTSSVTGGWGILEIGSGNVSITGAVASNGSVGVNGNGTVTVSGSGSITGNLYVNGNSNVTLSGAAVVDGSAWDKGSGKFTMTGSAAVKEVAYLDKAVTQSYAWSTSINGDTYQNGSGFKSGDISSDASGASAAQTAAQQAQTTYTNFFNNNFSQLSQNPVNKVGPSTVNSSHAPVTITGSSNPKTVNVVNLTKLNLSGDASLTLSAPADGFFVIMDSGTFSIGGAAQVVLQGGLTYNNVTFVNTGTSTVSLGGSGKINGNILSPNGAISLTGAAQYSGSLVGGKNITLSGSVHSPIQIPWLTSPSGSSSIHGAYLVQ